MTHSNSDDRLDQIENLLQQFIAASVADRQASNERMTRLEESIASDRQASNERMTRLEESIASDRQASNERMTRIEEGLDRVEKIVESNNRFLESFSSDIKRYTETMNNLANRMDGIIATANSDRQETNSRLAAIQRQVSAIARHLGVV